MRALRLRLWLSLALLLVAGCKGKPVKAPYPRGQAPDPQVLLKAAEARYGSTLVSKAKIREGRSPGARLLLRAEAPARLLGTVEVAGNPLVQLAMHEEGYALRLIRGQAGSQPGYYAGPANPCAVRSILGVDLPQEQMVSLVLGGGPVIDGPLQVVDQQWVKRPGVERLTLENGREREQIDFAWVDDQWWFAGAKLWRLDAGTARWVWTIEHEDIGDGQGSIGPSKTHVRTPDGKGGTVALNITYQRRSSTPRGSDPSVPPSGDDGDDGFDDDGGWDDAGDDDTWDDEGWEDGAEPPADAPPPAADPIPAIYRLEAGGLPDRGALCR